MRTLYIVFILTLLISCDRSAVTIENNSDRDIQFLIATEKGFSQKDLVLGRKLKGIEYTPRYGFLKTKDSKRIQSPFDTMSWADGVNSLCENQAITFIFVPSDDWMVPDLVPDTKWEKRKELTLTVRELDSLGWTIKYLP
jgi:hypothetical protein